MEGPRGDAPTLKRPRAVRRRIEAGCFLTHKYGGRGTEGRR